MHRPVNITGACNAPVQNCQVGSPRGPHSPRILPTPCISRIMLSQFYLSNLKSTEQFGWHIGQIVQAPTFIALGGEMGSGKTTLVQAIAKGLLVDELVTSPTFVMINEYHSGRLPLYHLDFYRLLDLPNSQGIPFDLLSAQLDEISKTQAVVIIEWASIFADQFGQDLVNLSENGYLSLELRADPHNDQARLVKFKPVGQKDQSVFRLADDLCKLSKELLEKKFAD